MASFPTFPSLDFSGLDTRKLADLDDKVAALVRDAAYVTIGFGVLTVQQLQVRRRELKAALGKGTDERSARLGERLDALEATLDRAVGRLEERLPQQAAAVVGQAHSLAKAARKQVRGLVVNAA